MKGTWKYERVIWEKRKSLNKNDRDQVLWARETEPPTQTLVFTKTGGRQPGWGYFYLRSSREKGKRPFLFPVSSRLILVFALSQFSGLHFLSRSLEQTKMRSEGRKKIFWDRHPLISTATPPPPTYLNRHPLISGSGWPGLPLISRSGYATV